jgi:hypothetical protein
MGITDDADVPTVSSVMDWIAHRLAHDCFAGADRMGKASVAPLAVEPPIVDLPAHANATGIVANLQGSHRVPADLGR